MQGQSSPVQVKGPYTGSILMHVGTVALRKTLFLESAWFLNMTFFTSYGIWVAQRKHGFRGRRSLIICGDLCK